MFLHTQISLLIFHWRRSRLKGWLSLGNTHCEDISLINWQRNVVKYLPISFTFPSHLLTSGSVCKAPSISSTIQPSSILTMSSSKSTSSSFWPATSGAGPSSKSPKRSKPVRGFTGMVVAAFVAIEALTGSGKLSEIGFGQRVNAPSASVHAIRFSRGQNAN